MTSTKLISDQRYEYDGLKLLRVDERTRADQDGEVEAGEISWRTLQAATYGPGIVGNLLGKVVYTHTDGDATPDSQADYYYHYDHVGNVYLITDDEAEEVYRFSQDAFGNELDFGNYTGDSRSNAAAAGINEHQTGKWIDDFSGLYFFHARWYDSQVGRWFGGRDPIRQYGGKIYSISSNVPTKIVDPTGRFRIGGGCYPFDEPITPGGPWSHGDSCCPKDIVNRSPPDSGALFVNPPAIGMPGYGLSILNNLQATV